MSTAGAAETPQEHLARQFAAALQARDPAAMERLLHPKVRACRNEANRAYFEPLVTHFEEVPPADYRLTVTPLTEPPQLPGLPPEMFAYPVPPTHQFSIDWESGPNKFVSMIRTIASVGDDWFIVYPCPNAAGAAYVEEEIARGREARARAAALLAALGEPLRGELKALLAADRKIDAVRKYQAAAGTDLSTAMSVVTLLERAN